MTRLLLNLVGVPALPYDVLRLVFDEATREDTRKAVKYALISKLVRNWVEVCLYENVQLYRAAPLRKFLRTLQSSTKPKSFFATRVKSLSIVYDIHEIERTTRVLSICTGVQNLTIWAVPTQALSIEGTVDPPPFYDGSHSLAPREVAHRPPPLLAPTHHYYPHHQLDNYLHTLKHHLRPKRLSILVHSPLHIPITSKISPTIIHHPSPNFSLGIFSDLTHLIIVNGWTEWSSWAWSWINVIPLLPPNTVGSLYPLEFLPNLTHLSLEVQVGKHTAAAPLNDNQNRGRRNLTLTERVGRALARILASPELNPHLHVLVCVLSFDDAPSLTAHQIREETIHSLIVLRSETLTSPGGGSKLGGDPRLVFAYDGEPFRKREAGSVKVWDMWKRAEEIVRLQKQGYGRGFLGGENFDPIIL